jgi:hypothetical protein
MVGEWQQISITAINIMLFQFMQSFFMISLLLALPYGGCCRSY